LISYFVASAFNFEKSDQGNVADNMLPKLSCGFLILYNLYLYIRLSPHVKISKIIMPFGVFLLLTGVSFLLYYAIKYNGVSYISMYLKVLLWLVATLVLYMHFMVVPHKERKWLTLVFCWAYVGNSILVFFTQYYYGEVEYGSGSSAYAILPLLFLVMRNKKILMPLCIFIFIVSVASLMRKPLLLCGIIFIIMWKEILHGVSLKMFFFGVLLLAIGVGAYIQTSLDQIIERNAMELESDEYGSGRTVFWLIIWQNFWKQDIINIIFGNGYGSVHELMQHEYGMPIGSHNGFLDCLYSYGLFGLTIYGSIFYKLLKSVKDVQRINKYWGKIFLLTILVWFVQNIIYFGFEGPGMLNYSFIFAFICSMISRRFSINKRKSIYKKVRIRLAR
jgi:hypothetical protein